MSQSSNYNCISADCARVVYREYLPPVIRWRYSNEEWQEIQADDYAIEQEEGQCPGVLYIFKINYNYFPQGPIRSRTLKLYGPILDIDIQERDGATYIGVLAATSANDQTIKFHQIDSYPSRFSPFQTRYISDLARND